MEDTLGTAYSENKGIILLGDFNIDLLPDRNHPNVKSWTDVVSNFELEQIITQPTRITETTSTLIDHIYVNTNVNIKNSDVIQWSISDHFPVYAAIETDNNLKNNTNNKILNEKHNEISYMKVKGFDNQQFSNDVAAAMQNFSNNNLNTDINDIVSQWTFLLKHVIDSHCPRIKKRVKREKQPGWITDDLIDLMHMRDLAKRRGQHNNYKHFRRRRRRRRKMFIRQMTLKKYKLNNMSGCLPLRLNESLAWKPPKYK